MNLRNFQLFSYAVTDFNLFELFTYAVTVFSFFKYLLLQLQCSFFQLFSYAVTVFHFSIIFLLQLQFSNVFPELVLLISILWEGKVGWVDLRPRCTSIFLPFRSERLTLSVLLPCGIVHFSVGLGFRCVS